MKHCRRLIHITTVETVFFVDAARGLDLNCVFTGVKGAVHSPLAAVSDRIYREIDKRPQRAPSRSCMRYGSVSVCFKRTYKITCFFSKEKNLMDVWCEMR